MVITDTDRDLLPEDAEKYDEANDRLDVFIRKFFNKEITGKQLGAAADQVHADLISKLSPAEAVNANNNREEIINLVQRIKGGK